MECPHCKNTLSIPDNHLTNMECYHNSILSKTECCGMAVRCQPIFTFKAYAYEGDRKEDDWGNKFNKSKTN